MKNSLLLLFSFCIICNFTYAQNNIQLHINHMLGNDLFAIESPAKNNLDHDFDATRLEYYISEIMITHDGGTETVIEDTWILANAANGITTQQDLGSHEISQVEKISFYIDLSKPCEWYRNNQLSI